MNRYRKLFAPFLTGEKVGDDDVAYCPQHENPATSKKPSAQINFDKGIWWCFASCYPEANEATLKHLAGVLQERIDSGEISLDDLPVGPAEEAAADKPAPRAKQRRPVPTPEQIKAWQTSLADIPERVDWLLNDRGLTADTIAAWEIGYSNLLHRYTMPVYEDERLIDARCRAADPAATTDKYIWWRGGINPPLFGVHMLPEDARYIVLMEGELDVILAWQMGLPAITGTAGAGTWKEHWTSFFAGRDVYICYDTDDAGHKGRGRVTRAIREVAHSVCWVELDAVA